MFLEKTSEFFALLAEFYNLYSSPSKLERLLCQSCYRVRCSWIFRFLLPKKISVLGSAMKFDAIISESGFSTDLHHKMALL